MAIALVGTIGTATLGGSGLAVTPAYGQTPTAGNLLVAWFVALRASGVPTFPANPAGWSGINFSSTGTAAGAFYYKTAAGSDTAPTFAAVTGEFLGVQLAEFSGVVAPFNPNTQKAGTSTTSPVTLTDNAVDPVPNCLVLHAYGAVYSAAATKTLTITGNNGQSPVATTNASTSTVNHYAFAYAFTNSHAAATTSTLTFTTTSLSSSVLGIVQTAQPSYRGGTAEIGMGTAMSRAATR